MKKLRRSLGLCMLFVMVSLYFNPSPQPVAANYSDYRAAWRIWMEVQSDPDHFKVFEEVDILQFNPTFEKWDVLDTMRIDLTPRCEVVGQLEYMVIDERNSIFFDGGSHIECLDINLGSAINWLASIIKESYPGLYESMPVPLVCGNPDDSCRIEATGIATYADVKVDDPIGSYNRFPILSYQHIFFALEQNGSALGIDWMVNGVYTPALTFPGQVQVYQKFMVAQENCWGMGCTSPLPFSFFLDDAREPYTVDGNYAYTYDGGPGNIFYIGFNPNSYYSEHFVGWMNYLFFDPTNTCAACAY